VFKQLGLSSVFQLWQILRRPEKVHMPSPSSFELLLFLRLQLLIDQISNDDNQKLISLSISQPFALCIEIFNEW